MSLDMVTMVTKKSVFKYGYHGYKNIDMLYFSNDGR